MALNLKIGTRKSPLALWQAEWVKKRLLETGDVGSVELVKIMTSGDKILDVPLAKVGGKALFTKEIEEALLKKEVDLAVHSLKDVPTQLPDGLAVNVIPEREDPRDALLSRGVLLKELPQKARIGTSSLRRRAQLMRIRPDFEIVEIRGNLETRLRKLEDEKLDAIILAVAGMVRMGYEEKISERLPTSVMLPAVGQGALGIETRENDGVVESVVAKLHHKPTAYCVNAERAFLRKLEGGCQVPIGAFARLDGDTISIKGLVADLNGEQCFEAGVNGNVLQAENLGTRLAEKLISQGAGEILSEFYQL